MTRHPVFIKDGQAASGKAIKKASKQVPHQPKSVPSDPAPEEDLGGGDIVSLEHEPSTDDDKPLE